YENNIIFKLEQNVLLEKEINVFDQEMNDIEEEINALEEEIKFALDIIKSENKTEKIKLKTFCNEVADFLKLFPTTYDTSIRQIPYLQTNKPRSPGRLPTYLNMGKLHMIPHKFTLNEFLSQKSDYNK
ncbi:12356_t:CDS:1, partial [Racocetra persica]